ncbi:MAG: tetratricopeptide repeat protein, partial [Acidobacteriota bacterium]
PILLLLVVVTIVFARLPKVDLGYAQGFLTRRRWNWLPLGLTYAFLYLGQTFYQSSRYEDAIPALERSVRLTTDPSRFGYQVSKAHYMLGQALARVGRRGEAKVHLERSQELKSELSKGEAEDIQEHIYGTNKRPGSGMGSGDFSDLASNTEPHVILARDRPSDRARAELEKAIAFYRNVCSSAYQNLARAYIQRSAFGPAADYLEKAVSWDDTAPDIYFNLGLAGLRAGHLSRAFRALKKAMERKPAKKETLRVLGSLALKLVEERETGLALETVNYLLERNDSVADLFLLRGQIYAQKGLFAEALAEFQKGLQKNPRLARAHYLSGTVLIRTGQLRAARQEFDKVLELNPNHAGALYHEAFVLIEERKMKQAAPLLEKAIRLAPDNADAYYQLGKIQQNQGQLIQAIANLETAAHLNPSGAHIFYQLSRAYRKAGRKEEGTRALERYRQLKKEQEERRLKNHSGPQ